MAAGEYRPDPIDTARVTLGRELSTLIERLAENNHELWALGRMREGWTRGDRRDDLRKEHPTLIPYEQLPEAEKEYDRTMAAETLRVITALGFQILPPDGAVVWPGTASQEARLRDVSRVLTSCGPASLPELVRLWREHVERDWRAEPHLYVALAKCFLRLGDPLLAYEVLVEARAGQARPALEIEHLLGLALARSGSVQRANQIARSLAAMVHDESTMAEEVFGLLGRTHKELALGAEDTRDRHDQLEAAFAAYREAFARSDGFYSAVNASAVALMLDRTEDALAFAQHAKQRALQALSAAPAGRDVYWEVATLAEALLILGESSEARRRYMEAAQLRPGGYGEIASTRKQARLILRHRGFDTSWLDEALHVPRVVVFAGDAIGSEETRIRQTLAERLDKVDAGFGFSAGVAGSELTFLETIAARHGRTWIVQPYPQEQFLLTDVRQDWLDRRQRALSHASEVVVASAAPFSGSAAVFEYASLLMVGLAAIQTDAIDTDLVLMAMCNERDPASETAAVVRCWRRAGHAVEIIEPGQ